MIRFMKEFEDFNFTKPLSLFPRASIVHGDEHDNFSPIKSGDSLLVIFAPAHLSVFDGRAGSWE